MSNISFQPLPGQMGKQQFGMEVLGVDVAAGVEQSLLMEMAQVFVQQKVLLIRNQMLTTEQYAAFGRSWASTTRIDSFTEMHVPGFDDINIIGNVGPLFEDEAYRNGASFWHTDCAAEPDADATTMLYCLKAPANGGETVIADMQWAYDDLDQEIKTKIDPLIAHHCYAGAKPIIGGREIWEHPLTPVSEETAKNFPPAVTRPLVRPHTITSTKRSVCARRLHIRSGWNCQRRCRNPDSSNQITCHYREILLRSSTSPRRYFNLGQHIHHALR